MKRAVVTAFGLALLLGIYLVYRGGWPIVIIGLAAIASGILYTAGPFALSYTGLADLFVLMFFGPVAVAGTYWVQAMQINAVVIAAGVAPGLFSVAILTVNNLRDIDSDREAGKKTLAVRCGRTFARWEYTLALGLACLLPVAPVAVTGRHYLVLMALMTIIPAARAAARVLGGAEGSSLNQVLAYTGRLLLLYSLLFSIGWLL
jgi:1,4-dihydroxy-2-naphthoate octaprenyltransferase